MRDIRANAFQRGAGSFDAMFVVYAFLAAVVLLVIMNKDNKFLERYRLGDQAILSAARKAARSGVDTIVLQSGEDPAYRKRRIARIVAQIKDETGLAITLSLGNRSMETYRLWWRAGASRYLLKHETADPVLYAAYHPGDSLENRITALKRLHDVGFATGTGFIVGLPGQDDEALMKDILLTRSMQVEMCGVGPFIPQQNTPLAYQPAGSVSKTLKIIAYLRSHIPRLNIPATTALVSLSPEHGHELALRAGANVIMPNFTPAKQRAKYCIYDGKAEVSMEDACSAIRRTMRTVSMRTARGI
jgi:biotin synthase